MNINGNKISMPIAGVRERILGGFIDLIILFILVLFIGYISNLATTPESGVGISITGVPFLIVLFLCFLIFTIMEYYTGKTPGKYIANTRVVTKDMQNISFLQALLRNMGRFIDSIAFNLVGLIIILFVKKKQRFGDLIANTFVISESSNPPL